MRSLQAIALSTSTNLGIAFLGAVSGILAARALGPELRGDLAVLMAWFAISLVITEVGQSAAVTYFVAKDPQNGYEYIVVARRIMLAGSIVLVAIGFISAELLADGQTQLAMIYRVMFTGTLLNALAAPYVYALQALSFPKWNLVRATQPIVYVCCIFSLFLMDSITLFTAIISTIFSIAAQLFVALLLARDIIQGRSRLVRSGSTKLFKFGISQSASAIPATIAGQYDKVVLAWNISAYQIGQYAVALTVSNIGLSFSTAVSSVVFPRSAKLNGSEVGRVRLENISLIMLGIILAIVLVGTGWLSQPLVPFLFGVDFEEAAPLVWFMLPTVWLVGMNSLTAVLIRGRGRPLYASVGQLVSLLLGIILLASLVPEFGILAAPLGLGVAELVSLAVNTLILHKTRKTMGALNTKLEEV